MAILDGFTRTTDTTDKEAVEINRLSNEVLRAREIGRILQQVRDGRFKDSPTEFKRWIVRHLDISPQSARRYLALFEQGETFEEYGAIRLLEVYRALHLEGRPTDLCSIQ